MWYEKKFDFFQWTFAAKTFCNIIKKQSSQFISGWRNYIPWLRIRSETNKIVSHQSVFKCSILVILGTIQHSNKIKVHEKKLRFVQVSDKVIMEKWLSTVNFLNTLCSIEAEAINISSDLPYWIQLSLLMSFATSRRHMFTSLEE